MHSNSLNNNRSWLLDGLIITAILSLLFLPHLGNRPYYLPDGARYSEIPREMVASGDYVTPRINNIKYFEKPPLFYWLQAASLKLFGLSETTMQLPTALLGLLGCLFNYIAGRMLFSRFCGWLASLILGTSFLYVVLSQLITLDLPLTIFITGCLYAFIIANHSQNRSKAQYWFLSLYIFAALAVLTKGLVGLLLPGLVMFLWVFGFKRWTDLKSYCIPTGSLLFLLLTVPWHYLVQKTNPEFLHFYFVEQQFTRYLTEDVGHLEPFWFFVPVLILGFFPWISLLPQALVWSWRNVPNKPITRFLIIWPTSIFLFFTISQSKLIPYLLPAIPPLALLLAFYVEQYWFAKRRLPIASLAILFVLNFALIAGLFLMPNLTTLTNSSYYLSLRWCLSFVLIIGVSIVVYHSYTRAFKHTIITLFAISVLSYSLLLALSPALGARTTKPLAIELKKRISPNDIVICYDDYYQDLPVYLERFVHFAKYRGELDFGLRQEASPLYLETSEVWRLWRSKKRAFMVTPIRDYKAFDKELPMYKFGQTRRDVLLSNQP